MKEICVIFLSICFSYTFAQTKTIPTKYKLDGFCISAQQYEKLNIMPCQIFYSTFDYKRKNHIIVSDTFTFSILTKINFQYNNKIYYSRKSKIKLAKSFLKNKEKIDSLRFKVQSEFMKRNRLEFKYGVIIIGNEGEATLQSINRFQLCYRKNRFLFKFSKFRKYLNR
jgi:hypothetical protein